MRKKYYLRCFLFIICIIAGCARDKNLSQPTRYYYKNSEQQIANIGRIAIVELENETGYPQISNDITESLFQAIQQKQIFGLSIVYQKNPLWKSLQLEPDTTYNLDQMAAIHDNLKCNGVLIGTITEFKPYPHMAVGLRLKLIDLTSGELLWAIEQVWNSSEKRTVNNIRKYFKETKSPISKSSNEELTVVSPLAFIKFISYEVAETL